MHHKIETQLSGSTCCVLFFDRNAIFCANAGDSRAALFSYYGAQRAMGVQQLSTDHKPSNPLEKHRIIQSGGRVDRMRHNNGRPVGPNRVWLQQGCGETSMS